MKNLALRATTTGIFLTSIAALAWTADYKLGSGPVEEIGTEEVVELEKEPSSTTKGLTSLEDFLQTYLVEHPEITREDRMLLEATARNSDLIAQYSDIAETEFAFIAAQLYTEIGMGKDFDPLRCSKAKACGSGQVKEIAFLETMYSILAIPGGFNEEGKSVVKTLNPRKLESDKNERYVETWQRAFSEISPDFITQINRYMSFSLVDYQERLDDRKEKYVAAEKEYWTIVKTGKAYQNPRDDELQEILKELREDQAKDNEDLREALKDFWQTEILVGLEDQGLWYTIDTAVTNGHWKDTLDLIGQLNMRREYAEFKGNSLIFNIEIDSVQKGITRYNSDPEYRRIIGERQEVISSFIDVYHEANL